CCAARSSSRTARSRAPSATASTCRARSRTTSAPAPPCDPVRHRLDRRRLAGMPPGRRRSGVLRSTCCSAAEVLRLLAGPERRVDCLAGGGLVVAGLADQQPVVHMADPSDLFGDGLSLA